MQMPMLQDVKQTKFHIECSAVNKQQQQQQQKQQQHQGVACSKHLKMPRTLNRAIKLAEPQASNHAHAQHARQH